MNLVHPLYRLAKRFPQIMIPLSPGASSTPLYRDLVLRGKRRLLVPDGFSFSEADELKPWQTPAGPAEVLYLKERVDFERCVCALAYRCEPRPIPSSMGATTISGLIDWKRIRDHQAEYEAAGGKAWKDEFKRFTADPNNYRATLIVVGNGYYSAVAPETVNISPDEWLDRSLTIRTYHELTHFVCRRWYPQDIDPIRDEVIADAVGLVAAFGVYDPYKASLFLGIETDDYRLGGRLENYQKDNLPISKAVDTARTWVKHVADTLSDDCYKDPFAIIHRLMEMR